MGVVVRDDHRDPTAVEIVTANSRNIRPDPSHRHDRMNTATSDTLMVSTVEPDLAAPASAASKRFCALFEMRETSPSTTTASSTRIRSRWSAPSARGCRAVAEQVAITRSPMSESGTKEEKKKKAQRCFDKHGVRKRTARDFSK